MYNNNIVFYHSPLCLRIRNLHTINLLICNVHLILAGRQDTVITWSFKGEPRNSGRFDVDRQSGSTLTIQNIQKSDEGEYTCSGRGTIGSNIITGTSTVQLIVNGKPG